MYLSIRATTCSGERCFSMLKRVKNYLRPNRNQDGHTTLALLSIKTQLVQKINQNKRKKIMCTLVFVN